MGILGKVVSGLEIVAGAALIATGAGALVGSMLITEGLVGEGVIGGSIGKFLKSGLGQGLMGAVTLGAGGMALYGQDALTAVTAEDTAADAAAGASGESSAAALNTAVAADNDAMATSTSFLQTSGAQGLVPSDPALGTDISGASPGSMTQLAQQTSAGTPGLGDASMQADESQLAQTETANAGGGSMPGGKLNPMAPAGADVSGGGAAPPADGAQPGDLTGVTPSSQTGDLSKIPAGGNPNMPGYTDPTAPAPQGGLLSAALNSKGGSSAITAGGSILGGVGRGIMDKQTMEQQEAALQWGNTQWANQNQADQAIAAAAKPITVPSGYLQRAQQVRAMMGASSGVPQPTPQGGGPVPVAAMAPPPVPGQASANASAAVPRGGVI